MIKDDLILVVERDLLFKEKDFQGYLPASNYDYFNLILENYQWQPRNEVEDNDNFQQPIGYCIIYNSEINKVFAFQRHVDDSKYSDKRLQGKWSWGVGGHIDKADALVNKDQDPITTATLRELEEEVVIDGQIKPELIGYINDDQDDVGQVHFGIVYLIRTDAIKVEPNDDEIMNYSFTSLDNLNRINNSQDKIVENWSKIVFSPINSLLSSNNNQQQS